MAIYYIGEIKSIDPVHFAFAFVDLGPIFIGIYGTFLAFLSAGLIIAPKGTSLATKLVTWFIGVLQVWSMISTLGTFLKLKAALNYPVTDLFEITLQTGWISTAFLVATMSFLFGISMYAAGGIEGMFEIFLYRKNERQRRN